MRYFTVLDFQYVVLLIFLGLIVLLGLYLAFGGSRWASRVKGSPAKLEKYPEDIEVGNRGIPPILILIYLGFVAWVIGYWIVIGLLSGPF